MRFISSRVHGILDYVVGLLLVIAPFVLDFSDQPAATWVFVVLGVAALIYSLLTDYEWGVVRKIPLSVHLNLDIASGLVLALSPWIFGFSERVWVPHVVAGLFEIMAGTMTQKVPGARLQSVGNPGNL